MYNNLDRIPACDGQTDILRRHTPRYAYASRDNHVVHEDTTVFSCLCFYKVHLLNRKYHNSLLRNVLTAACILDK